MEKGDLAEGRLRRKLDALALAERHHGLGLPDSGVS